MSILCLIFCTGCSSIVTGNTVNADGSRVDYFSFSLDQTALETKNIDPIASMTAIDNIINQWWQDISISKDLSAITFSNTAGSTALSRNITINFQSFEAWANFMNYSTTASPSIVIDGFFYDKRIVYDGYLDFDTYSAVYNLNGLYDDIITYFSDTYFEGDNAQIEQTLSDITIHFVKAYPASALVHSNADYVTKNSNYSIHLWSTSLQNLNSSDTANQKQIFIYQAIYNAHNIANWYLVSLCSVIIFGIILTLLLINNKRKLLSKNAPDETNIISK